MLLNIAGRCGKQTRRGWRRIRPPFSSGGHPGGEDSGISKRKTPRRGWGDPREPRGADPGGLLEGRKNLGQHGTTEHHPAPRAEGVPAPGHSPGGCRGAQQPPALVLCHLPSGQREPRGQSRPGRTRRCPEGRDAAGAERDAEHRDVPGGTALPRTRPGEQSPVREGPWCYRTLLALPTVPRDTEISPTCKSSFYCREARGVPVEQGEAPGRGAGLQKGLVASIFSPLFLQ